MSRMSPMSVSPEYGALLQRVALKVIRTEKENEAYTEVLYDSTGAASRLRRPRRK